MTNPNQARVAVSERHAVFRILVLLALVLLSCAVGFYAQAAALNYAAHLRVMIMYGCIPQVLLVWLLWYVAPRTYRFIGAVALIGSWWFVAQLAILVLAR